jgi:hypothetical protein
LVLVVDNQLLGDKKAKVFSTVPGQQVKKGHLTKPDEKDGGIQRQNVHSVSFYF